ncbi:uncharacterized protein LOC111121476 isoform X3 [Crassostrea virginica]
MKTREGLSTAVLVLSFLVLYCNVCVRASTTESSTTQVSDTTEPETFASAGITNATVTEAVTSASTEDYNSTSTEEESTLSTNSTDSPLTDPSTSSSTEPSTITSTESSTMTSTEPVTSPTTESSTMTSTEPDTSPTTESSTMTSTEPDTSPTTESSTMTSTEPVTSPTTESSTMTSTEPVTSPTTESSTMTSIEPVTSPTTESSTMTSTEPDTSPTTETSTIASTEPVTSPTTESSTMTSTEPFTSPTNESSTITSTEPDTSPTTESSTITSTEPSTSTTNAIMSSDSTTTSMEPMTTIGVSSTNFAAGLTIQAPVSNQTTLNAEMTTALTTIFNVTRGFLRIDVTIVWSRSGSIVTDFNIVSESSQKVDAQTDIAKKILQLLSQTTNVTYNGAQYPVDMFSVKDSGGQHTNFTSVVDICAIFISIDPCQTGTCTNVGGEPTCMNVTTTTDFTSAVSYTETTTEPLTTPTEPPTTSTVPPTTSPEQPTTSTEPTTTSSEPPTTSTVPPTTSTEPPTTSTEPPTTSTVPPTTSTEPPTTSTEPPTTSTEPPTTSTEPLTTSTEPPTISTEPPTTSTELPTTSTVPPTTSTEAPTTSTEAPTTSTEPPTTSTEPPTTSTEPPTTSTEPPTTSTEPPTTSTVPPTTSTEPPTTSTEPPTTSTVPPTTITELPTTSTEAPTTSTEPPTTSTVPPTTSTEAPTTSTEQPTTSTEPPTTSTVPLTTSTEAPTTSTEPPTTSTVPPTTSTEAQTTSTEAPTTSTVPPTTSTEIPTTSTEAPTTSTEPPTTSTVPPTTSTEEPTTSTEPPTTSTELPTTSTVPPTTLTELPTTSTEAPTTSTEPPTTSTVPPTTSTEAPTTSTEPPTTSTEPPTTSTEPPTTSTEPPTTSTVPPTTSTVPPTTSTEPPTTSTNPSTTSTEPPTTSTEPPTTSSEPPTTSTEPPTTSTEQPTTSTETPTTSTEPPTTSTEPPTSSTEPPTTSTEPPTTSTEPPTTSTEPPTTSTEPPTTSTEPPTTSSEPPTTSTEPPTTSTEQPTTSTETPTTSTEPQTTSTEPPTTSTEPPTTSTEPPTTSTEPPTTSTEPPTTSTEPPTTSTEPPTSSTEPPTTSTVPPTTSTEPPTTSTEPPTTSTEPPTTSTEPPTTSTEPPTSSTEPPTTSTVPPTTSTEPPTTSTEPPTTSTEPPTTSTEPPTTSTVASTTSTEPPITSTAPEVSFAASITINATITNATTVNDDMKAALTPIFRNTAGFQRLVVTGVRSGSIVVDFYIVVVVQVTSDAQTDISISIVGLLSGSLNLTYANQTYTVETISITDSTGQNTSLTTADDACVIFTAFKPCQSGNCSVIGGKPTCPNIPTTEMTTSMTTAQSTEPATTTTEPATTTTEPATTTTEPATTTTEPATTTTEPATTTESSTTSTIPPATSTELPTTSTELPTTSTEPQTTSTELPITSTEPPTTSTEPPTTSTVPPTTSTVPPTTSTEPPTTSTEPPTTSTEPPTTSTEQPTTSTEPPTTSTEPLTTSTEPPTTSTEPQTTSTEPPTTSTQPLTTSTEPPTTSTEPPTTVKVPAVNEPLEFGLLQGDTRLTGDDRSSPALESPTGIYIGDGSGGAFTKLYVGTNGIISLQEIFNRFSPLDLDSGEMLRHKVICPYWVDLMTYGQDSAVYYHLYKREVSGDSDVLQRVDRIIQTEYLDFPKFKSSIVFKATWNNMAFYMDISKTVTFQTLVVSDGKNTFSITYYMNVDVIPMHNTNISIGYRYGLSREKNAYAWQTAAYRLSTVPGNTGYTGFWVSKLTSDNIVVNPLELECYNWYASQSLYSRPFIPWNLRCPCFGNMLRFQGFRFAIHRFDEVNNVICYVSLTSGPSLECCYSFFRLRWAGIQLGSLSRRIPAAGSVLQANPFFQSRDYYEFDRRPKEVCCASGHCDWYYALRPIRLGCNRRIRTRTSWFFGDPHITTLDGGQYTFNGYGEYTMMKIDYNGTTFDFQARTDLATTANGTTINATIFSAFVAKDHTGSTMQVEMSRNRDKMYIYGNGRDLTTAIESNGEYVFRTINMTIAKENETIVASFINTAITIKISLGVRFLTSETMVDAQYNGQVVGLMGNFDGNSTNDFILPNGTTIDADDVKSERQIYNNFGQLWSINSSTSLFQYGAGLSHADYSHPEFVPFYIDEQPQDAVNRSREACGGASASQACIFDYLATGDKALADSSGNNAESSDSDRENLENEAPEITGDSQVNAEVRKPVEIKFNATDDGQYTYKILQQPLGFSFNNTTGIATWTPPDASVANISITVVDDKGAEASPLDVSIILCSGCNNHGDCSYNSTRPSSSELFKHAECICHTGYSGQDCQNDTDACAEIPCALGRNCTDLSPEDEAAFGRGYNCSDCPAGFAEVDEKCEDINECNSTSLNNCNSETETCENTEGSFACNCKPGFRKAGSICQDIDECTESTSGCQQLCNNTLGSFTCSCVSGFALDANNKTCTGTSSCPTNLGCEYACTTNDANVEVCICKNGFKLEDNEKNCTDVDECKLTGICSQNCQNSVGSYTCSCFTGFSLNEDKTTCSACEVPKYGDNCNQTCSCGKGMDRCDAVQGCVCKEGWRGDKCDVDIDECEETPTICGSDKICKNLEGSHACDCREGFQKEGSNCIDIDECSSVLLNNCTTLTSNCSNQDGGFTCRCNHGYTEKNLFECEDFDECQANVDGCSQICKNVDGGFNCECEFGYSLDDDRKTCSKVKDVCSLFPNLNCSYGCNSNGSHGFCFCQAGYQLNAQDQESCIDVDECNNDTLNQCSNKDLCVNLEGSYKCTCPDYSTLQNDERTCKECDGFHFGKNCENPCNCGIGSSRCDKEKGCVCKTGWTGAKCDLDIDECAATNPCTGGNQVCQNSPGAYKCICENGYKDSSGACTDIDECVEGPCSQKCTNTNGGYSCSCNDGFRLKGTSECEDYDECSAPVSPCDQKCTNTLGSFKCFCNEGFLLNTTTRTTCYAKTECTNTSCTQNCGVRSDGSEYCFCNAGYVLNNTDLITCDDVDDCSPKPCSDTCQQNAAGQGYSCSCPAGKKLDVDERSCIECENGTFGDKCLSNCTCNVQNTESCEKVTGNCTCKTGWEGIDCSIDIDECENTTICPEFSVCENKNGSYSCNCNSGYSLASGKCVECALNRYGENCANDCLCEQANTQSCDKVNGSCTCKDGWQGTNCTDDVLECSNTTICGSNANCSETTGSYTCVCNVGYKKNSGGSCIDINECFLGTDMCDANADCINNGGSYTCSCRPGFSGDGHSCTRCNDTHYGRNCANLCTCIVNNTADCHDETGQCTCKAGWTGDTCNTDVDECTTSRHNCNTTIENCTNIDGGFVCACLYGNSSTGCIVKESPYVPPSTQVKIGLTVTFTQSISLENYEVAKDKMKTTLTDYYKGRIPGFVKVLILLIRSGSTVVEHEIVTNKTQDSDIQQIELVSKLLGQQNIEYDGINLTTSQIAITDTSGKTVVVKPESSRCDVYVVLYPCAQGQRCVEENNNVYCTGIVDDYDDFKLIVGLGVGLSLLFLTVLVVILIVVYIRIQRRKKEGSLSSDDNSDDALGGHGMYFSSGIPTKIDSWGRHGYPYSPHHWVGTGVKRGRDGFDDVNSAREPYMYDNGVQSNFSWDFMYQALQPNEKFQIKRPEVSSKPMNTQ